MGYATATDLAEGIETLEGLKSALKFHLAVNHYPAVHPIFVDVCVEAINYALNDDWNVRLTMPNGITKDVAGIVSGLHLTAFIDN